jgi:hypothetical protein
MCNICGSNHTMDACRQKGFPNTNADASVKWIDSVVKRGRTDTIATGVRVDQRSPSSITQNRASERRRKLASSGSCKRSQSPSLSCTYLHCQQVMLTEMCGAQRTSPTSSLTDIPSIVQILNHSTEQLTIFCLFDSGALQYSYASERAAAWCREHFPRKIGDTASGRVCHQSLLVAPQLVRRYHQLALILLMIL